LLIDVHAITAKAHIETYIEHCICLCCFPSGHNIKQPSPLYCVLYMKIYLKAT